MLVDVGKIPEYLNEKDALVKVYHEDGYIHVSWLLENGTVISFEDIPGNYPRSSLCVWKDIREYIDGIKGVNWIIESLKDNPEVRKFLDV